MNLQKIETPDAPAALGPYSQGVAAGNLIFTSGQIPLYPGTKNIESDPKKATLLVLRNLLNIVTAAGGSLETIAFVNICVRDKNILGSFNEVYADFFASHHPARFVTEVTFIPADAIMELSVIAYKN